MKTYLYTTSYTNFIPVILYRKIVSLFLLISISLITIANGGSSELRFENAKREQGKEGANGTIYRFREVMKDVDALVRISGRSHSKVKLVSIDLTNTGWQKAFQPQVTYNDGKVSGSLDWWMEFEITFVEKGAVNPVVVNNFDVTALDIDGHGNRVREYVSFYKPKSFLLENNSLLNVTNLLQSILGMLTPGKRFDGPKSDYPNIDTSATSLMVTSKYENTNSFRIRTGGASSGSSSNATRMYSMYFKSFTYTDPTEFTLPLVLNAFNASLQNRNVVLNWETGMEKELSHFVVERSVDGVTYNDAGIVFATGNSNAKLRYQFTDVLNTMSQGTLYYRLRMVDTDQKYQKSPIRVIRTGETFANINVQAYPNPVVNEVHVTIPMAWQNKPVQYAVYNANGHLVKQVKTQSASQTETINVNDLGAGMYVVRVVSGAGQGTQRVVKK